MANDTLARMLALTAGGGEPAAYLKSAAVEGNKLTLTNKDNTTVEFVYTAGEGINITNGVISLSLATAETQNF